MFCQNCGNNVEDNMAFCGFCGAKMQRPEQSAQYQQQAQYQQPIQQQNNAYQQQGQYQPQNNAYQQQAQYQPQQYSQPFPDQPQPYAPNAPQLQPGGAAVKTVRSKKPLIIMIIVIAVAVIGVGVSMFLFLPKGGASASDKASAIVTNSGVAYNGKLVDNSEQVKFFSAASLSGDCFVSQSDISVIKNGKLFKTNADTQTHYGFSLAASGNGIAYYNSDHGVELMDTNTGEITVIEESGGFYGVTISPDGKTVAYSDGKGIYLYRNGKSEQIMFRDMMLGVVSVADDGKYVYVFDWLNDKSLYCLDSEGFILEKVQGIEHFAFITNRDNTQIGYNTSDGWNIYDAAEDKTYSYSGGMLSINNTNGPLSEYTYDTDARIDKIMTGCRYPATHYNVDDLTHCKYYFGHKIIETNGATSVMITENSGFAFEQPDGSIISLEYQENSFSAPQTLVKYSGGKKEIISEEASNGIGLSESGNSIFYCTSDNTLMQYKNGKSTVIATDIKEKASNIFSDDIPVILGDDIVAYPVSDDSWYLYKNGNTEKLGSDISAMNYVTTDTVYATNGVTRIRSMNNRMALCTDSYFVYEDGGDLFIIDSAGTKKPLED